MDPTTTKVIRFHQIGDASALKIDSLPLAKPKENELQIKVEAIGLNRAEVMFRKGAYLEAPELPSRLGYEAAGIVEAIGKNVQNLSVGDQVSTIPAFSMGEYGIYAERAVVPVHAVVKAPKGFNSHQSAAIWMQYITAYGALIDSAQLEQGQCVLITAASSSVGVAAIHLAKHLGARVIATTRGSSKIPFLREQGADHVIQTDAEDLVTETMRITQGRGVELVFDPIGGPGVAQLAEASAQGARIIEYGALDEEPTPFPLFTALAKGLVIQGYTLFEITQNEGKLAAAKTYLLDLFNSGAVLPVIDKVFPFEEIQGAHRYMESNQQMGKIIIDVSTSK